MLNKTISTTTAIAGMVFVTFMNGYISTSMMTKHSSMYKASSDSLLVMNQKLHTELEQFYQYGIEVDVTMYQPNTIQCDDTPNITADGTRIRIHKASEYKFVALSRNLLKRWGGPFDYGDFILVKGTKNKDGVYQVRDTMNPKWVKRVDILTTNSRFKYENITMYKYVKDNYLITDSGL